jgi:hypothetical protein
MNAPAANLPKHASDEHQTMVGHAEQWRGECIQYFAELEQIIEDLLLDLKRTAKAGRKVSTGQPVGCAFGHLRELTADKGLFGKRSAALATTLGKLAADFEWRAHLTHGVLSVWQGRGSKWLLTFAHRPVGGETVRMHAQTWVDARAMRERLGKAIQDIRAQAGSLRSSLKQA